MNTKNITEGLEVAYGLHPHFRAGHNCDHALIIDVKGEKYENDDGTINRCYRQNRIAIAVHNQHTDSWEPRVVSPGDLPGTWEQYLKNQQKHRAEAAIARSCREFWADRADQVKQELADLGLTKFAIDSYHCIAKIPLSEMDILLRKVRGD